MHRPNGWSLVGAIVAAIGFAWAAWVAWSALGSMCASGSACPPHPVLESSVLVAAAVAAGVLGVSISWHSSRGGRGRPAPQ